MNVVVCGQSVDYDGAVNLMDDEIRERLHDEMAGCCTEQEFIDAYSREHAIKFDEEFVVN